MTRSITNFYKRFVCNKINYGFAKKIYECNDQSRILARDCDIDRLNGVLVNQVDSAQI